MSHEEDVADRLKQRARRLDFTPRIDQSTEREMSKQAGSVIADQLDQYVQRYERLDVEKKDITGAQGDLKHELTANGYDPKVFMELIRIRKMDPGVAAERGSLLDLYKNAMGMG